MSEHAGLERQLTHALASHSQWKVRLRDAIARGTSDLTTSTVSRDDQCEFGKWLHGPLDAELVGSVHYERCVAAHRAFHRAAAATLGLALTGDAVEAEARLRPGGEFANASAAVVREILAWQKELAA